MKKLIFVLSLCFSIISGSAQVIFKNTGTATVNIAICYYDNVQKTWVSRGWFKIKPDEKRPVHEYTKTDNPHFYYCAQINNCDKGYFGNNKIFVNIVDTFTITSANQPQKLNNPNVVEYGFIGINLSGIKSYTVKLKSSKFDCAGLKEGKWIFGLDKEGNFAAKAEDIVYYRNITFAKGKPIGWCKDFYPDSTLKAEFKLLSYEPFQYDGKCRWYKKDGSLEREVLYQNGVAVAETDLRPPGKKQ